MMESEWIQWHLSKQARDGHDERERRDAWEAAGCSALFGLSRLSWCFAWTRPTRST